MPKSSESELDRLRKENIQLHKTLTALETQLRESNRRSTELSKQLTESLAGNKDLRYQLKDLQEKLDILIVQFKKRNRKDFGSKTEKHNPQRALDQSSTRKKPTTSSKSIQSDSISRKHIRNHKLPGEPVFHPVAPEDAICPHCAIATSFVSNKLSYQLDKIVHTIRYLEHQQEVRSCRKCKVYIVTAKKPDAAHGQFSPALRSDIITGRFGDGLPHNRQEKRFKREDVSVPRSTQSDCSLDSALTLELLYEVMTREVRTSSVINTDDSEIKIQDHKIKGRMRKGKMTVYVARSLKLTVFDFSPDQTFDRNKTWFKDFVGCVQADAARGFDALFKDIWRTEVGCHAHSRRRYYDCLPIEPKRCKVILDIYEKLYAVERDIKGKTPAERLAARRSRSKPLIKKLHKKVLALKGTLNPTHALMSAVDYTLNHWIALTRFLKNPDLDIDNNSAEQAIKDFVLMRKNSLFVGSDAGGRAAAIHLSFMASCKANNINPVEYLTDVFTRINSMKTSELAQLLPNRWAKSRKAC
jgi:transposase/regulator of replication initiation timing